MIKYETRIGPSLLIAIVLVLVFGAHLAFAEKVDRHWEAAPYVDFTGTAHGGFGKHYDGLSVGMGVGAEALLVMSDRFAVGANAKTVAVYDVYTTFENETIVDEYGVWFASLGPIVYVGDMFYVTAMIQYNLDVFYENTYRHEGTNDEDIDKLDYSIDDIDWWFETGFRVDYHASIYLAANTHLIETAANNARYHLYCGLKFFF